MPTPYTIKAVCECREFSEDELVVGVRQSWGTNIGGGLWWVIHLVLVLLTVGGWLSILILWLFFKYFFSPTYQCQYCEEQIPKQNHR